MRHVRQNEQELVSLLDALMKNVFFRGESISQTYHFCKVLENMLKHSFQNKKKQIHHVLPNTNKEEHGLVGFPLVFKGDTYL